MFDRRRLPEAPPVCLPPALRRRYDRALRECERQRAGLERRSGRLCRRIAAGAVLTPEDLVPSSAASAAHGQFVFLPGTNFGTCKLIALAGTSITPITMDNIVSGC